ncbi:MAG: hypothetical protein AAF297_09455, partial [Planctomycetota bacterium]
MGRKRLTVWTRLLIAGVISGVAMIVLGSLVQPSMAPHAASAAFRVSEDGDLEEIPMPVDPKIRYDIEFVRRSGWFGYDAELSETATTTAEAMLRDPGPVTDVGRSVIAARGGDDA